MNEEGQTIINSDGNSRHFSTLIGMPSPSCLPPQLLPHSSLFPSLTETFIFSMSSYHKASSEISSNMEEDEKVAFLAQDDSIPHHTSKANWRQPLLLVALNGVLLFCSILTLSATVFLHRAVSENSSESERNALLKQTSHYCTSASSLIVFL